MKTTIGIVFIVFGALIVVSAKADVFELSSGETSLQFVSVGDTGNVKDTRFSYAPYGAVSYSYQIGKYEVTNAQYIDFLNHVAATDTYGLFDPKMGSKLSGGISRSGSSGSYTYGPRNNDTNWLNRPVIYVSYWNACRFVNWLQNGQPTGLQNASTTENGAYPLNGYTGSYGEQIVRNANAIFVIPSANEWYKAAYYKGGGINAGYWTYPTQSDLPPIAEAPPGGTSPPGSACVGSTLLPPYYTVEVGAYKYSPGTYGTFDQGGNASELTEELYGHGYAGYRVAPGGSWALGPEYVMSPGNSIIAPPNKGESGVGFRVVMVPEPSTIALMLTATLGGLLWWRRRR
jgi:formylglycine-generating enzyme required for sulfatase activity